MHVHTPPHLRQESILAFAVPQWRHTRGFRVEDAYKWLFQATLGGEHAAISMSMARRWLSMEWRTVGKPRPGEPLVVYLRPDHRLLRVNLRPFKAMGGTEHQMLNLFVESAHAFHGRKGDFLSEWRALREQVQKRSIRGVTELAWRRMDRQVRPLGYPADDHSSAYMALQKPSYRVVENRLWKPLAALLRRRRGYSRQP